MTHRTVLNVVDKIVSPVRDSHMMGGVTQRAFLMSVPAALTDLEIEHALVYGAIEGSDEASLGGTSSLVRVRNGETEEFRVSPDSVSLSQATRADVLWKSVEDEASHSLAALEGEAGPVEDLILYNAALRLWTADGDTSLAGWVEWARKALYSGAALTLLDRLRQPVPVGG